MNDIYYQVLEEEAGKRIDQFLALLEPEISRSHFQKLIKSGSVKVNGITVKNSYQVQTDDEVVCIMDDLSEPDIMPEDIPLDILYEDSDVIIVNKPKGMVVHPAPGHYSGTLVNALMYHCEDLSGINGVKRPGIVHRIDMNTTGSLIVCKNDNAHNLIAQQIKVHSVNRIYEGIVIGTPKENKGIINAPIGRNPKDRKKMAITNDGREAITEYEVLESFKGYSYMRFKLQTGRTHQIRVHMASVGHPLLGDDVYGPAKCDFKLSGQTLHAKTIGFIHPSTNEYVEVEAPLPAYFTDLIKKLR